MLALIFIFSNSDVISKSDNYLIIPTEALCLGESNVAQNAGVHLITVTTPYIQHIPDVYL
jgi:hypothetical protein